MLTYVGNSRGRTYRTSNFTAGMNLTKPEKKMMHCTAPHSASSVCLWLSNGKMWGCITEFPLQGDFYPNWQLSSSFYGQTDALLGDCKPSELSSIGWHLQGGDWLVKLYSWAVVKLLLNRRERFSGPEECPGGRAEMMPGKVALMAGGSCQGCILMQIRACHCAVNLKLVQGEQLWAPFRITALAHSTACRN